MSRIFLLLSLLFTIYSCKEDTTRAPKSTPPPQTVKEDNSDEIRWKGTDIHELTNGSAKLRLPKQWERSTQATAFAKEGLAVDQEVLDVIKLVFSQMNYEADVLDVFEMPSAGYRSIFILNTDTISMTKGSVGQLTRNIQAGYQQLDEEKPDVLIKNMGHKYLDDPEHKMLRFKYSFSNRTDERASYLSIFFITTLYRSFIVYEISDSEEDSGLYMWSIEKG